VLRDDLKKGRTALPTLSLFAQYDLALIGWLEKNREGTGRCVTFFKDSISAGRSPSPIFSQPQSNLLWAALLENKVGRYNCFLEKLD